MESWVQTRMSWDEGRRTYRDELLLALRSKPGRHLHRLSHFVYDLVLTTVGRRSPEWRIPVRYSARTETYFRCLGTNQFRSSMQGKACLRSREIPGEIRIRSAVFH